MVGYKRSVSRFRYPSANYTLNTNTATLLQLHLACHISMEPMPELILVKCCQEFAAESPPQFYDGWNLGMSQPGIPTVIPTLILRISWSLALLEFFIKTFTQVMCNWECMDLAKNHSYNIRYFSNCGLFFSHNNYNSPHVDIRWSFE